MRASMLFALFGVLLVNAQSTDYYGTTETQAQTSQQLTTQQAYTTGGNVFTTTEPATNCACTPQNIWLDIIFAIDSSDAMTSAGLDSAMDYVLSALARMTIGQELGQRTRVGFIFYSAQSVIQSNLTTFTSTDQLFDVFYNPSNFFQGSRGTNIEAAIKDATDLFDTNNGHRNNTKRVLVVLASSYTPGDYNDPNQAAKTFKNDGGKIIAIEYVQVHGSVVPNLRDIASPGYFLSNSQQDLHVNDLIQLFCYANCFCTTNYLPYGNGGAYDVPLGGCYFPVTITSIERLTETTCFRDHLNGTLTTIEDQFKSNFVNNMFNSRSQYWIGLKRSAPGSPFQWVNGMPVSYTAWASGEPSSNGNCVMATVPSGFNVQWFAKDCLQNDYMYACQTSPCDTDKYCTAALTSSV